MTVVIYLGEVIFAIALAIMLLAASTLEFSIAIFLFCCGFVAWTLAEYITHRFVLHAITPVQHGRRRSSGRRSRRLRLVFIYPLLCPPQSRNSPGFLGEASPRPSQVCKPKLRCNDEGLGSCVRNDGPIKLAAPTDEWSGLGNVRKHRARLGTSFGRKRSAPTSII